MAGEPNYDILSKWMAYYSRYATRKKGVILGFSLLQLVTFEPRDIAILKAQPRQSLPCSSQVSATRHSFASVHPVLTRPVLPLVSIAMCSWKFPRNSSLVCHISDAGTEPHVPTCCSFGHLCAWRSCPCTEAHLCSEVFTIRRCSPLDLVTMASYLLLWLVC
jgi:hypothetical protein